MMLNIKSKIIKILQLGMFLMLNPKTIIIGGPSVFWMLGKRYENFNFRFYSQAGQDSYLLMKYYKEFCKPGFPKLIIDVGCNHPVRHNNSYFFERYMGFKVIGVDALDKYKNEWSEIRPNAELIISAVGEKDGTLEFEETEHDGYEGDMYSAVKGQSKKAEKLKRINRIVPVTTLTNILQSRGVDDVGIMSIDIEGYELSALQGLDANKIKIRIIILENNTNGALGDENIRKYMASRGYVFKARIWGLDDIYEHVSLNATDSTDLKMAVE